MKKINLNEYINNEVLKSKELCKEINEILSKKNIKTKTVIASLIALLRVGFDQIKYSKEKALEIINLMWDEGNERNRDE